MKKEFQEIGHCGGKFKVEVKTPPNQKRSYSLSWSSSNPYPASIVGIYTDQSGYPMGMIQLGGIGTPFNPPPAPNCLTIFIASDREGLFGHECPRCQGYWRSSGPSAVSDTCCPYCRLTVGGENFLTSAQRIYLHGCSEMITNAIASLDNGIEYISMDEIADSVTKEIKLPKFYYTQESQQKKYTCKNCNSFNDILGKYGFCSSCGRYNGLQELQIDLERIKLKISSGSHEDTLRDAVSAFDSVAKSYLLKLVQQIPMTKRRRNDFLKRRFHNLKINEKDLKEIFDIRLFEKVSDKDISFIHKMFARRHIHEHNGGEVDQKYIDESSDTSVRLKQKINETKEDIIRIIELIQTIGQNLDKGFNLIFEKP